MNFGEKLIEARKAKNLSQEDLGKLVSIDKRIISRYETNKTAPSIEVAKKTFYSNTLAMKKRL